MADARAVSRERLAWIDIAKGITMIVVVAHHVLAGLRGAGLTSPRLAYWHPVVDMFQMPVFFMIAGFFARSSIEGDLRSFIDRRIVYFVYLYLIWAAVDTLLRAALSGVTTNKVAVSEVFTILWDPAFNLWFIYALAIMFVLNRSLRRVPPVAVAVIAAAAVGFVDFFPPDGPGRFVGRILEFWVYFVLGVYASAEIRTTIERQTPIVSVTIAGTFIAALIAARISELMFVRAVSVFLSLFGCLAVMATARILAPTHAGVPLAAVGVASLGIYLMHFIPAAGVRIILVRLGVTDPYVIFVTGTVLSVVGCYVAYRIIAPRIPVLFRPPRVLALARA